MRVLQLIDSLNAGGAEKLAVVLTNQLSKKGYNHISVLQDKRGF